MTVVFFYQYDLSPVLWMRVSGWDPYRVSGDDLESVYEKKINVAHPETPETDK